MSWIIDADAHVSESADIWTKRLPAKWQDDAPRMVRDEDGEDYWYIGGQRALASVGGTAYAGFVENEEWGLMTRPRNFDEIPIPAWDAKARLQYLNSVNIWAQVIYPNVGGFGNQAFFKMEDQGLRLACVQAYNDWLLEWCSEDSRRLIPVMATPFWDIDATVKEIERCAALGHRAVLFTGEPQRWDLPYFADHRWDPVWSTVEDTGLTVSLHVGSGDNEFHLKNQRIKFQGVRSSTALMMSGLFLGNAVQVVDLLLSGIFPRHPKLKVVSVESGAGWLPFALEAADYFFEQFGVNQEMPEYEGLPSDYVRDHLYVTYFFENRHIGQLLNQIGTDNILFETDYPHAVSLYAKHVAEAISASLGDQPDEIRRQLTWGNSASLYKVAVPDEAPADLQSA